MGEVAVNQWLMDKYVLINTLVLTLQRYKQLFTQQINPLSQLSPFVCALKKSGTNSVKYRTSRQYFNLFSVRHWQHAITRRSGCQISWNGSSVCRQLNRPTNAMQIQLIDLNFSSFSGVKHVHPKIMGLFLPGILCYCFTLPSLLYALILCILHYEYSPSLYHGMQP